MAAGISKQVAYSIFYKGGTVPADIEKINAAKKARETAQQQAVVAEKNAMDVQTRPMSLTEASKLVEGKGISGVQPIPLDFALQTASSKGPLIPFVSTEDEQPKEATDKEILGLPMKTWAWIIGAILLLIILIVVAIKISKAGK